MHSRVFVVSTSEFEDSITPEEIYEQVLVVTGMADYVAGTDDFEEDIEWLKETYDLQSLVKERKIFKVNAKELLEKLQEDVIQRMHHIINKLKEIENKQGIEFIEAFHRATIDVSTYTGFLFYIDGAGVMRDDDFVKYLNWTINEYNPEYLYIIDSLDYHA